MRSADGPRGAGERAGRRGQHAAARGGGVRARAPARAAARRARARQPGAAQPPPHGAHPPRRRAQPRQLPQGVLASPRTPTHANTFARHTRTLQCATRETVPRTSASRLTCRVRVSRRDTGRRIVRASDTLPNICMWPQSPDSKCAERDEAEQERTKHQLLRIRQQQ